MDAQPGTEVRGARRPRLPLTRRGLATGLLGLIAVALLLLVAPPAAAVRQIVSMNMLWIVGVLALELGSCFSYPVLFRRFFPEPPRAVSRRVAWMAMGAGAVLPGGNISSAAATGMLLRKHGVSSPPLLERCGALLCLLTAFGFCVNGLAAILLLAGVPDGPHDLSHTVFPILVSTVVLSSGFGAALIARRLGPRAPRVLRGVAAGLEGAWKTARTPSWRLLGGVGFMCLDQAALWAACAATGHHVGVLAVAVAYCIGYLATLIPMPAGLGVLDSGLAGSLVLYGMPPAAAVGAVLVYHAISIWVPAVGGLLAWLPERARARAQRPVERPAGPLPTSPLPTVASPLPSASAP